LIDLDSGTSMINGKSVDEMINSCDKDGNGVIDYNEFKACILG
jgi:Ca2+-binding EF-hand superfamily protein